MLGKASLKLAALASSLLLAGGFVSYRAGAFDRWTPPAPPAPETTNDELFNFANESEPPGSLIFSTKSAPVFAAPDDPSKPIFTPTNEFVRPEAPGQTSVKDAIEKGATRTMTVPPPSEVIQAGSKSMMIDLTPPAPAPNPEPDSVLRGNGNEGPPSRFNNARKAP